MRQLHVSSGLRLREQAYSKEGLGMTLDSRTRLELLRSAPLDKWIALSQDESRIVAVGNDYGEVVEKSEAAGESDPLILKTPPEWAPLSL
jgi:hypothetical protein